MPGPVTSAANIIAVPLTVTASAAYSANNVVGSLMQIATGLDPSKTVILTDVVVDVKSTQTGEIDLVFFSSWPSSTTVTDKSAIAVNAADSAKVQAVVPMISYMSLGTPTAYFANGLSTCLSVDPTGTLWMAAVTRGTPTFTATTDVTVLLKVVQ